MFEVHPMIITFIIGVLLPLVNGLVFKYTSNPNYLKLVNAVLVLVAEAIAFALNDSGQYVFDHEVLSYFFQSLIALVTAQFAYQHGFVALRLTSRPDGVLPTNVGIKLGDRLDAEMPPQH